MLNDSNNLLVYELQYWKLIKTISWLQIKNKCKVIFDTLVANCEGALYYILKDEPGFLDYFKKIIIENDFHDIEHNFLLIMILKDLILKRLILWMFWTMC